MKFKNAFSLIEVLLVMGIMAVVTAMGFSIAKTGMERAYNLYWYTGYSTLADGTFDAEKKDVISSPFNLNSYAEHLRKLITNSTYEYNSGTVEASLLAPNGIDFHFKNGGQYVTIAMMVPHSKKTAAYWTNFIYDYSDNNGSPNLVYPGHCPINDQTGEPVNTCLDLQDRPDLLPFYIRIRRNNKIKDFYSFREAYCKVYGQTYKESDNIAKIECPAGITQVSGKIRHISPKKAY